MWGRKAQVAARKGVISGRVQSVAFRFYTRQEATQLQLRGWVRNLPAGSVEFQVEGDPTALDEFIAWLSVGPPRAQVSGVDSEECAVEGFSSFEIR
ncbi:MAG: acylphosphatase [Planctomycetota bacterium]|jgi:acylphosphatase